MTAASRWRAELEAWAIPQELLDAVPDSPYSWPPELWKRRTAATEQSAEEPETTGIVRDLLGDGGTLLDVGAGTGRASLPLGAEGHRLTAVEKNPGMAQGLREEAARLGVDVAVVEGAWPGVAGAAGRHDVAMSAHVVYDVQDIVPFLRALHAAAERAVVIELTPQHPWVGLAPYYRALHDLDRPDGPTVELLVEVVGEELGVEPEVAHWSRPGGLRFADRAELVGFFRRRVVLPEEREPELAALLEPEIAEDGEWLLLGGGERELATVWWRTA